MNEFFPFLRTLLPYNENRSIVKPFKAKSYSSFVFLVVLIKIYKKIVFTFKFDYKVRIFVK